MQENNRKDEIDRLAVLPIDYLLNGDGWVEERWLEDCASESYRAVFMAGLWAYQLHIYHGLVRNRYGHDMAHQVWVCQRRFLDLQAGTAQLVERALDLIDGAMNSGTVRVSVGQSEIAIPIEMKAAIALLLGMPESPNYVENSDQRIEQIRRMQPEIDWCLAQHLIRSREEMVNKFTPVLDAIGSDQLPYPAVIMS